MYRQTAVKILTTTLLFVVLLPLVCFALPAAAVAGMPGGCHGHHEPIPTSSHSCCYAPPQPPAQVQIAPTATPRSITIADVVPFMVENARPILAVSWNADLSPPPQLILRI